MLNLIRDTRSRPVYVAMIETIDSVDSIKAISLVSLRGEQSKQAQKQTKRTCSTALHYTVALFDKPFMVFRNYILIQLGSNNKENW